MIVKDVGVVLKQLLIDERLSRLKNHTNKRHSLFRFNVINVENKYDSRSKNASVQTDID